MKKRRTKKKLMRMGRAMRVSIERGCESFSYSVPDRKFGEIDNFLGSLTGGAAERPGSNWRDLFKSDIRAHGEPGLALKGARLKEELTQAKLAERIGIEQSNVAAMESGKRPIGKEMAKRLAEELGVDYRIFL